MNTCIIECIFGSDFSSVHPAINNIDSYFFTNNTRLKKNIEKKGWIYKYIDFPISNDITLSSFQSKYIKLLQFLKEDKYNYFNKYDSIIYIDHKFKIKYEHTLILLNLLEDKKILIRKHHFNRSNIWEEFGESMLQERYFRFMSQTISYIRCKIREGYSDEPEIVWTSLMVYKHLDSRTLDFLNNVYNDLISVGTSECQIIWSILGQKYKDIIKIVSNDIIDIERKNPKTNIFFKIINSTISFLIPYGIHKILKK